MHRLESAALSRFYREALARIRDGGGRLEWQTCGRWTTPELVARPVPGPCPFGWSVYYPTVAALGRRGLLVRCEESPDELRDPRRLPTHPLHEPRRERDAR